MLLLSGIEWDCYRYLRWQLEMLFKLPFINFIRGDNAFNKFGRSVLGHFKRIWIIKDILSVRDDLCKKIRSSAVHLFPFLCIQVETPKETKSWIFHHFFVTISDKSHLNSFTSDSHLKARIEWHFTQRNLEWFLVNDFTTRLATTQMIF